jgi:hypothetical protein
MDFTSLLRCWGLMGYSRANSLSLFNKLNYHQLKLVIKGAVVE